MLCDCVWVCVYVGGVVDVDECGLFLRLGVCWWIVSLCSGCVGCCALKIQKNCLSNLYHTYIIPYLIYCIEGWGNASHCHILPLFLTQKKLFGFNHILETFSSHRTYIQIIKYSSTQQSLLSQN